MAKEVLRVAAHPNSTDDDVAPKLGYIFKAELTAAASDGFLSPKLFDLLYSIFDTLKLDTQEIEGINGLLKRCIDLAPNIAVELLSSRMLAKKNLQVNFGSAAAREDLIQQCIENHKDIKAEFDKRSRKGAMVM